ncbi:MAG: hypothetical protein AAGJ70_03615, partial [Pseudomonadota bacterium]
YILTKPEYYKSLGISEKFEGMTARLCLPARLDASAAADALKQRGLAIELQESFSSDAEIASLIESGFCQIVATDRALEELLVSLDSLTGTLINLSEGRLYRGNEVGPNILVTLPPLTSVASHADERRHTRFMNCASEHHPRRWYRKCLFAARVGGLSGCENLQIVYAEAVEFCRGSSWIISPKGDVQKAIKPCRCAGETALSTFKQRGYLEDYDDRQRGNQSPLFYAFNRCTQ